MFYGFVRLFYGLSSLGLLCLHCSGMLRCRRKLELDGGWFSKQDDVVVVSLHHHQCLSLDRWLQSKSDCAKAEANRANFVFSAPPSTTGGWISSTRREGRRGGYDSGGLAGGTGSFTEREDTS